MNEKIVLKIDPKVEKALKGYIAEFRKLHEAGVANFQAACEVYVKAIETNPQAVFLFQDTFKKDIHRSMWTTIEAVGRHQIAPAIALFGGGRYTSRIKHLPYALQERIANDELFEYLTPRGEVLMVDVRTILPEQANQMFNGDSIRTVAEQRSYVEAKRLCPDEPAIPMPYTIVKHKVVFHKNTVLTVREVEQLLAAMKGKQKAQKGKG